MDLTFTVTLTDLSDGTDPNLVHEQLTATVVGMVNRYSHTGESVLVRMETGPEQCQCIVMTGNPRDGMGFYGPYSTADDATNAAVDYAPGEWLVVQLDSPETLADPNADG